MKSQEMLMLQECWRRALRDGELTLVFKTTAGANRARMQLYNAVKQYKAGREADDVSLLRATDQIEIVWGNAEHTILRMQRKDSSDMIQGVQEALGMKVTDFVDPEIAASSERLLKELGLVAAAPKPIIPPPEPSPAPVPFYGKRGE